MSVLKIWFIDFQPLLKIIFIGKIWVLPMIVKQQRGMKSSTRPQHSVLSLIKLWNMFIYMYNWQLIIMELKCYVGFQGTMSFKRFEKLSWYFHLNDNGTQGLRGTLKIENGSDPAADERLQRMKAWSWYTEVLNTPHIFCKLKHSRSTCNLWLQKLW